MSMCSHSVTFRACHSLRTLRAVAVAAFCLGPCAALGVSSQCAGGSHPRGGTCAFPDAIMAPSDPHSYADGEQAKTLSVDLDLAVDFATKTIQGTALLKLDRVVAGALDLDTRDLTIEKAVDGSGADVPLSLDVPHHIKGSRLRLTLHSDQVTISFKTSPSAMALQWLEPAQTAGGKEPYLLSQCQPIYARTIFPCQDTPEIRIKYTARLRIPSQLHAVMSAKHVGREPVGDDTSAAVEVFAMEQSIPPYLFALAVGDITYETLSPRSKVYAEPSVVKAAAEEFSGVESWITAAESLFGPYGWGEFNMLVMPPSFPYGGMENPTMTFLTPTLLVGDKTLVNVVAHELAHSWTGNLVTNTNAAHFWLNEGWTVYAERRILEVVEGLEKEQLHASIGYAEYKEAEHDFQEAEKKLPGSGLRFTQLDVGEAGLGEVDPDEVFSSVPYEKGFLFLTRLDQAVGRPAFDEFVAKYIKHFAFQSINTTQFLDFLKKELPSAADAVNLDAWVHGQGIPDDAPKPHSESLTAVKAAAESLANGIVPSEATVAQWGSREWATFMKSLPRVLSKETLESLDSSFHLLESKNLEIAVPFLAISARSGHTAELPKIESVLTSVGRMKYLKPLYQALVEGKEREFAERVFGENKPKYHPVAQSVVASVLKA